MSRVDNRPTGLMISLDVNVSVRHTPLVSKESTMNTSPTIADLEAASAAACDAHDKALARLSKMDEVIKALTVLSDEQSSEDLDDSDRKILWAINSEAAAFDLRVRRTALLVEIDRLETACHEAAHALDSADEAA